MEGEPLNLFLDEGIYGKWQPDGTMPPTYQGYQVDADGNGGGQEG